MNKEEVNPKFYYNQKVMISKGFYRGKIGKIKDFEINKDETITYHLQIENKETGKTTTEKVKEIFLKKFSLLPF